MKGRRERAIPKRPNGRGFPRIKRSFGYVGGVHVGTINVSSGTNEPKTYRRLHEMLDDLAERGESAILRRIRDGGAPGTKPMGNGSSRHYEILEVFRIWKSNRHIPNILGWRPLAEAMPEWLETAETVGSGPIAERTRKSYACNIRQLLKFADSKGGNAPTDAQLPELLEEFREYCIDREHWVPFNQVKTMCLSYARGTQAKRRDSDLYIALRRVAGLNTSKRKRERKSITVREVYEIMAKLPEREAQHLWNMCCLSIRPDEYARGQWEICRHDDYGEYVLITGTKNDNAERPVPLVKGVKKVRFAESTFRRCFRAAVGDKYVPRDCRSTGKRWRKDAGVSATRGLQYFAHSTAGMEHRYDTDELLPFVGLDAELINAFIEKQSGSFKILHQPVAELASV